MMAATHAKAQEDIMFIIRPIIPVLLMVNISIKETIKEMANDVSGPNINPPMAMITSFASYVKNPTEGMMRRPILWQMNTTT